MSPSPLFGSLAHWPIDWIIIGLFFGLVTIDALRGGNRRAATLSLAAPLALIMFAQLRSAALLGSLTQVFSSSLLQSLLFLIIFVALFVLVYRIIPAAFGSGALPMQSILAGLAATAIALIVWLQVPVLASVWPFGAQVHAIFAESFRLWWFLASYLAMAFSRS